MDKKPIIVKKTKKVISGGHHGGAWKVAYADFVTAMWAFFLMLWLISITPKDKLNMMSSYFTAGAIFDGKSAGGASQGNEDNGDNKSTFNKGKPSSGEEKDFENIMQNINNAFAQDAVLKDYKDNMIIDVTGEGLKIQIVDDKLRPMFKTNSDEIESYAKDILDGIAAYIKDAPNYIAVAGHTKSNPDINGLDAGGSDPWILSFNRANSVRMYLSNKIRADQITAVIGRSDKEPLNNDDPYDDRNMRVSILVMKRKVQD